MYKIYKHTNKINGKCYIGQTLKKDSKYRWGPNGNGYEHQPKFWNAIKKYGWDNFEHEILKTDIETMEEAIYWEAYFINKYDSINNGYNNREAGTAGAATALWKPVYQYSLEGDFIKKFNSLTQAWEETNIAFGSISKACDGKLKSAGNFQWRWEYATKINPIIRLTNAKKLQQFDLSGNLIASYNSGVEAEATTGISRSSIADCAQHHIRTAGEFVWRFANDEFSLAPIKTISVEVDQYTLDNRFIKTWHSMAAIYKELNISQGNIYACCTGLRNSAGGYKWQYHQNSQLKENITMTYEQKIQAIDNFIEQVYDLRKQAMEQGNEFSESNLVFKELRNAGYLDNLKDLKTEITAEKLSLESLNEDAKEAKTISKEDIRKIVNNATTKLSKISMFETDDFKFELNIVDQTEKDYGGDDYYTFWITGGLNGNGNWKDYLKDLSGLFNELEDKTGLKPYIIKEDTNCADDVFNIQVGLVKRGKEMSLEESKLKESQSQEIGSSYNKLSKLYNIDLDELVYGEDGFMKTCYPNGFPDFAGDVIYSEKYWNEFEKWLKDTKGITLTEALNEENMPSPDGTETRKKRVIFKKNGKLYIADYNKYKTGNLGTFDTERAAFDSPEETIDYECEYGPYKKSDFVVDIDEKLNLQESSLVKGIYDIDDENVIEYGWEKPDKFYVGKYYHIGDEPTWRTDFFKYYPSEEKAKAAFDKYVKQYRIDPAENEYPVEVDEMLYEMISGKERYEYINKIARLAKGNQPVIQDNGLFHIYNVKQSDFNIIVAALRRRDFIEECHAMPGRYDFSHPPVVPGQLPDRYYTITGKIREK